MVFKLFHRLKSLPPSKWGKGTSLYWKGNKPVTYWRALVSEKNKVDKIKSSHKNKFLFESARVGIFQYAKYLGLGRGDRVQVMAFTCEAVTDALSDLGCDIELYDCDENMVASEFKPETSVKLVVCQVSFGVQSISFEKLKELKDKKVPVLIDKALSYGISDFYKNNELEFPEIYSLEVSKSVTIGWGGVLCVPNAENEAALFNNYYLKIRSVSYIDDSFRVMKALLNLYMVKNGSALRFFFWVFLRIINFHRSSSESSRHKYQIHAAMGPISKKIFYCLLPSFGSFLERSNAHHEKLETALQKLGLRVLSRIDQSTSTPRIVFLLSLEFRSNLENYLTERGFELGSWFSQMPIDDYPSADSRLSGTSYLLNHAANLPCHWGLEDEEVDSLIECLISFTGNKNTFSG